VVYVISAGQVRVVPDKIAVLLVGAHPEKLYLADDGDRNKAAQDSQGPTGNANTDSRAVARRDRRRRKKPDRS
jgi:hypothetical protein